ncbi:MAG TPA: ribbon-helix-helix domain-containing protein [Candidatus Tectomicrobia bacterium]|nr:ribbon-helix-helix domain-containing protein [Candidatus Tectomicrobia bacterium]
MPDTDTTRWTVTVSRQTDITLRSFLAQRGLKKGDLSRFIEDAVRWRVLDQTITEARSKLADMPPAGLPATIDEATEQLRKEVRGRKHRPKKRH